MVKKQQILNFQLNKYLKTLFKETIGAYHHFFREELPIFYIDNFMAYEQCINPDVSGDYMNQLYFTKYDERHGNLFMREVQKMFLNLGSQPIRVDCATLYSNML